MTALFTMVHVIGGSVGLLSGDAALNFRKGAKYHRLAGNIFFISMLIMSATGAFVAIYVPEILSVSAGVLTFYLVATAWATVIRKEEVSGSFEIIAMLTAFAIAAFTFYFGMEALRNETGLHDGFPPGPYFFFGSIALLAGLLDAKMICSGGVSGKWRIVRHLWRMSFALFIAAASFFLGQQQVFPKALQGTFILAAPVLLVIGVMFYSLIRVSFTKWYMNSSRSSAP